MLEGWITLVDSNDMRYAVKSRLSSVLWCFFSWLLPSLIRFKFVISFKFDSFQSCFSCCFFIVVFEEFWREQHSSSNPMGREIPIEILSCVIKCCLCELDRVLASEICWQIDNARNIYLPAVCYWLKMMEKRKEKKQIQLRDQWPIWNRSKEASPILRLFGWRSFWQQWNIMKSYEIM